ncbi:MAG: DUF2071 domain-containing protein [Bryobacterales bacterium]|nr:DUF2071 domain-containing protein [Bryobacterales bacterium]
MQPFLTAHWAQLAMLNYDVPAEILLHRVPKGTELDTFEGRTMVSVVGFLFQDTRVMGVAIPMHVDFEEVNLRFYIRRGDKRAVAFIRELVPKRAIATVARRLYNEPYLAVPMRHRVDAGKSVSYEWEWREQWCGIHLETAGEAFDSAAGSEEEFITEHYWGYTAQRDGGTLEYRVEHPKWRVWRAAKATLTGDVASLYGAEFSGPLSKEPSSAFLAEGSAVSVYRGVRIA